NIDLLFVDDTNFQKYILGEEFKAFDYLSASFDTSTFIAQNSDVYHLIVSNEDVLYYTPFCNLKVNLYENEVGIEEQVKKKVLTQTLPTIFKEKLLFNLNQPSQVRIYETSGRLVYNSKMKIDKIDKSLSTGVYFVRFTFNNRDQIGKFVIIK
ncbi:T9SS type A sorting domain-containing protein, partial [candidate division WOR-3 bacterium]|nr:T9SS type A sorting domain-containing protein [candidate division WOR-3 bacterium]